MPRSVRILLIAGLAAFVVAGCGNKGPLVLPDQPAPAKHKKGAAPAKTPQDPAKTDSGSGGADAQR